MSKANFISSVKNLLIGRWGAIEPGHMMEWCWLLQSYQTLSVEDVSLYADRLYSAAISAGFNPRTGLLYDKVNIDGSIVEMTHETDL